MADKSSGPIFSRGRSAQGCERRIAVVGGRDEMQHHGEARAGTPSASFEPDLALTSPSYSKARQHHFRDPVASMHEAKEVRRRFQLETLGKEGRLELRVSMQQFLDDPQSGDKAYWFSVFMLLVIIASVIVLCLQVRRRPEDAARQTSPRLSPSPGYPVLNRPSHAADGASVRDRALEENWRHSRDHVQHDLHDRARRAPVHRRGASSVPSRARASHASLRARPLRR